MSTDGASAARHELSRALTNVPLVLGLFGVLTIGVIALFGAQLAPQDPQAQRVLVFYPGGRFEAPPTPPDELFLLGTDPLGRDQVSRLLWGARLTLGATLLGLAGRAALGLLVGVLAGWRRGHVDTALTWLTNAVAGFPQLMLALLIAVALREHGFFGFVVALASVGWAEVAQFVRGEVIRIRASAYVEAARALGASGLSVLRTHVLRNLAPQLAGVFALEAGSVLLLLAELGFIGLFISGGAFYVDDSNRPILPIRDRAPEWGQMLAGVRQYAFNQQYVAFIPGVVVVCAVFAFNLFGEGLRSASDPFGPKRLSPRTLGAVGRGLGALALVGIVGYGVVTARSGEISFTDAMRQSREAAQRLQPGWDMVAGVVRFRAGSHALAKPEKINFYFREPNGPTILRVGFVDADPNAMEVKMYDAEDDLPFASYRPIGDPVAAWDEALRHAEERGGRNYRAANNEWTVRVALVDEAEDPGLKYAVTYSRRVIGSGTITGVRVATDAVTGDIRGQNELGDATRLASQALGGPVQLSRASAFWRWQPPPAPSPLAAGAQRPSGRSYTFVRRDAPADLRTATVSYDAFSQSGAPTVSVFSQQVRPVVLAEPIDLVVAFQRVEDAGGRELRLGWERARRAWSVDASTGLRDGAAIVNVTYLAQDPSDRAQFRYDPRNGMVTKL
ncbi:MAG TPA: ABC transporter permease [Candidatus Limnocylindria bacterium]|nr:ABC transporter permease [Candidatus Limnocylindria bacterium]